MKLAELLLQMPLLTNYRPDFLADQFIEILRTCAIKLAMDTQTLERKYVVPLQCGVQNYLLDECEETIHTIRRLEFLDERGSVCSCRYDGSKYTVVSHIGGPASSCNGGQFRFVPPNTIEVGPVIGLSGTLTITATVAPKYDACEIDDLFGSNYRNALFYAASAMALESPGDNKDVTLARKFEQRAGDASTEIAVRRIIGHKNTAPTLKPARRFI